MPKLYKNHTKVTEIRDNYGYLAFRVFFDGQELPQIHPKEEGIRDVFGGEEYGVIVKVDRTYGGHDDRYHWKRLAKTKDRDHFVPTLESGKVNGRRWTCQPWMKLKWERSDEQFRFIRNLKDKYKLTDIHSGNWAIDELDTPIIFDYGM